MNKKFNNAKELYRSINAPKELKAKTLNAVNNPIAETEKPTIIKINFKALGAVAACVVICLSVLFANSFGKDNINVFFRGDAVTKSATVCYADDIEYISSTVAVSAKSSNTILNDTAIKLDINSDKEITVKASAGRIATENSQGEICEIANETIIEKGHPVYIITNGADEITVTLNANSQVKTLIISKNSDQTYSVRVK